MKLPETQGCPGSTKNDTNERFRDNGKENGSYRDYRGYINPMQAEIPEEPSSQPLSHAQNPKTKPQTLNRMRESFCGTGSLQHSAGCPLQQRPLRLG